MSSNERNRAAISLPVFAKYAKSSPDGWGIAYYKSSGREAVIRKKAERADLSEEFHHVVKRARSSLIIAHLRWKTAGRVCDENCHPFKYHFLNRDWVFAHNGKISSKVYPTHIVCGDIDSARIFEFMMKKIEKYYEHHGKICGIYSAIARSIKDVFKQYGKSIDFNFLMSDSVNLYAFHHKSKPVYFVRREKGRNSAILISTEKLSSEKWLSLPEDQLLAVSRGEIVVMSGKI